MCYCGDEIDEIHSFIHSAWVVVADIAIAIAIAAGKYQWTELF